MTYLPPDSGVPGGQPWPPQQPPPGVGYPPQSPGYPPQGPGYPPQGPGYAPQYPQYPPAAGYQQQGYGYQQPGYGYAPQAPEYGYQPAPQGFGYPGQGYPPPTPGGSGKWWLIGGGVAVVAVIGLVLAIVFATAGDSGSNSTASGRSSSAGSSDEDQIRSLMTTPAATGDELKQRMCANDQEILKKIGDLGALDVPSGGDHTGDVSITDIKVTGNKATARVEVTGTANPGLPDSTLYFRKESGDWKLCMTDSPALSGLPGMGGH